MQRTPGAEADLTASTRLVPEGKTQALLDAIRLRVVEGPDAGAACESAERLVVGTHPSANLVLTDRSVSRFHCELGLEEGLLTVRDLGSRNGTTVNGVRVLHAPLPPGSVLGLGLTRLAVDPAAAPSPVTISPRGRFGTMVGASVAMRRVFELLERAAAGEATVLLEGETGTGKEAAAESIHQARGQGPLVVIDCGAIPRELIESELFGHEKGSFTGAIRDRKGAFEAAHGGTLFLDEIGELPLDLQPKLLRALEKKEIKRVGQTRYQPVDVRIVAGTNRSLRAEVNAGRFRSDVYYRLAVVEVRLPPLRERLDDIPALVDRLLGEMRSLPAAEAERLRSPALLAELARHRWPGNVRELRNHLERCAVLHDAPLLELDDAPAASDSSGVDASLPLRDARERFDRAYLVELLRACDDNVALAARQAGVDRITLYRLLWKHGLRERT